jgi:UMP-CMP kinase
MSTPNTLWITVEGSGTAECDGLYCPSTAPEKVSESGTVSPLAASARAALPPFWPRRCLPAALALAQKSSLGYWNGKMAWDRVDGKAKRNPSISYSQSYKAWRIARLDGHLAYTIVNDDEVRRSKGILFPQFTQ